MITIDESKYKCSDVTLYDKNGNPIGIAKNVIITEEDDDSYTLTDSELSLLKDYYNNKTFSFIVELPLRDRIKLRFIMLMHDIKNKLFPSYRI